MGTAGIPGTGFQMAVLGKDADLATAMLHRAHEAKLLAEGPSDEADALLRFVDRPLEHPFARAQAPPQGRYRVTEACLVEACSA